jgi:rod shape-determining protein MreC
MKRRRAGYLVLGVLVAHLVVISGQVDTSPGTSVLHAVTFGLLSEAQRLVSSTVASGRDLWDGYVSLRGAHEEKIELQEQIARLQLRLQAQDALVQQAHSLERLLELDRTIELMTLSARVIGIDATPWFRTITVDRGLRDGVETELAVIAPGGVVGRVVGTPGMRAARVQLIIDRNAAASALIERTRVPGVVVGAGDGVSLRMQYVSNREDVQVGDAIVTSGADGIYPHGLAVGTVTSVRRGSSLYKTIDVEPATEFDRMEHVLIVTHDERLAAAGDVR